MSRRTTFLLALLAASCAAPAERPLVEQPPRAKAEGIDAEETDPCFSTFSICAVEPESGVAGVAVTTRVPMVGQAVPWVKGGVGAVATQAMTKVEYGPEGLKLLEEGLPAEEVIAKLLANDSARERRQLAVVDAHGHAAAHTGKENGVWAGSRQGKGFSVQGNILVSKATIDAVAAAFEHSEGSGRALGDRLIEALEKGYAAGGDKRKGLPQSAALVVSDPRKKNTWREPFTIRVDEHPEPVHELRRIYDRVTESLGYRTFSEIRGRDVAELEEKLLEIGYLTLPADSRPTGRRGVVYDTTMMDAVEKFRKEHGLPVEADGLGFPRGLVDQAFVDALNEALLHRGR